MNEILDKMKIYTLLMLIVINILPFEIYAQEQEKELNKEFISESKAIAFLEKNGTLIKKEYYDIEAVKVDGVSFENIILTDLLTKEKVGALRLETYYYYPSLNKQETYIGTLDYDEIDACIKSLEYIYENITKTVPSTYTECVYSSRDGVSISTFWREKKNCWEIALKTKKYISNSETYLKIDSILHIILNLNNAKAQLKELLNK